MGFGITSRSSVRSTLSTASTASGMSFHPSICRWETRWGRWISSREEWNHGYLQKVYWTDDVAEHTTQAWHFRILASLMERPKQAKAPLGRFADVSLDNYGTRHALFLHLKPLRRFIRGTLLARQVVPVRPDLTLWRSRLTVMLHLLPEEVGVEVASWYC